MAESIGIINNPPTASKNTPSSPVAMPARASAGITETNATPNPAEPAKIDISLLIPSILSVASRTAIAGERSCQNI